MNYDDFTTDKGNIRRKCLIYPLACDKVTVMHELKWLILLLNGANSNTMRNITVRLIIIICQTVLAH